MTDNENPGNTEKTIFAIATERREQKIMELEAKLKAATDMLEKVTKERNEAAGEIEQNERALAIDDLKKMGCTYGVEEFDRMSLEQLDQLKSHYKFFNPKPLFKSGADVSRETKSPFTSLDGLYVPLEERRKTM